ncbi:MAG TPA: 4Fe-4S cluster-binding domain-containing protein [bacterium]|nr:4Fe-4S cluster-binding domain-containing protein [bacterium]HPS29325.1 4Fe-4S cluster-binding domain-containing protein [bacterium]
MKVHSIFDSLQGEGYFQGFPTKFVRLYGCNLQCGYCDAQIAVSGGVFQEMPVSFLAEEINESRLNDICITGGEPFCQKKDLVILLGQIKSKRISIETNGSFDVSEIANEFKDVHFSIDWKTPSSGNTDFDIRNIEYLKNGKGWLKFVVSDEKDLMFVTDKLKLLENIEVFVSPVFENGDGWFRIAQKFVLKNHGLRFQLQLHKILGIE